MSDTTVATEARVVRKHVTDHDFISCWQTAASRAEVAQRLGLQKASVTIRANKLRKGGIRLKEMARLSVSRSKDVDALNALADSLL